MNAIIPARFDGAAWLAAEAVDNTTAVANNARTPSLDTVRTVQTRANTHNRRAVGPPLAKIVGPEGDMQVDRIVT
jgi:hypothetical protein